MPSTSENASRSHLVVEFASKGLNEKIGLSTVVDFGKLAKNSNFNPREWELIVDSISKFDKNSLRRAA